MAVALIVRGVVPHQGMAQSPTSVDLNNGSTESLIFAGTATNTTNPRQPITAPVRITFDKSANGILTVLPPLTGSGTCTIGQYSLDSGHIDIACKGTLNITWRGTISGAKAMGTYTVEPTHESGHFEWSITVPTKKELSARSDGDAAPAPTLNDIYSVGNGMVKNDAIGNDPALEKLCFELVKTGSPRRAMPAVIGEPVPFEIDSRYVKNARSSAEDVTFIAVLTKQPDIGGSSLVQCANQNRRGFDVMNYTIGEYPYWRVLTKQKPTVEGNGIPAQARIPATSDPKKLIAEKDFETEQLQFHEKMLATSSFAERTKLFCRDAADASLANNFHGFDHTAYSGADLAGSMAEARESQARRVILESIPHAPYGLTINELNSAHERLLRDQPSTREGEVMRQQKLSAIQYALADYNREFDACRKAVIYGEGGVTFPLPTNAELREKTAHERERIAEINRELASRR